MQNNKKDATLKNWILNNFIGILSLLQPVLIILYKNFIYSNDAWTTLEIILFTIIIIESCVILTKFLWNIFSYKSYYYPYTKISSNYIILEKRVTYTMTESDELQFSRSMIIKSKINNLESILDKYLWTGTSKASKPSAGQNIRSIEEQSLIGVWKYLRIILDANLCKGEVREINYNWPVIKNCTTSSPFFSTSTDEPTKKVVLAIQLGRNYAHRQIRLEEFRAIEADNPISVLDAQLDQNGNYTWDVLKVKRFRHYRIRWSWEDISVPEIKAGGE